MIEFCMCIAFVMLSVAITFGGCFLIAWFLNKVFPHMDDNQGLGVGLIVICCASLVTLLWHSYTKQIPLEWLF